MIKGSSDARQNPLHFIITTAGTDRHSIAFELHTKALDILEGRRVDPTFYPVVYGLKDDEDSEDEANWYKVFWAHEKTLVFSHALLLYYE